MGVGIEDTTKLKYIWIIKPDCSFFKITPKPNCECIYDLVPGIFEK